jgi:hypothetical protein
VASFSDFLEAALLDHLFGNSSYTAPTIYVALFTAAPSDTGGGTEATYTSYARVSTAASDWNAATGTSPTTIDNANEIAFPTSTGGGTETMTHFGLYDASTSGNLLVWGSLDTSKSVASGDTPKFAAGDLNVTLD